MLSIFMHSTGCGHAWKSGSYEAKGDSNMFSIPIFNPRNISIFKQQWSAVREEVKQRIVEKLQGMGENEEEPMML